MKYDAFISYRHAPLDMEIAKKLHKGLETFPIPVPVQKKTGKKKIRRVFRDQEELPIGADLTEKISSAIRESEYLIVVCSKDTPESYWVQKEIETFIEMHDRSHALAILVDGEPGESFPAQLLTDANGDPVEPLAADVRGETKAERSKKFKSELLRLAAPIIGCSYDDLRQRHRERVIRKVVGIVGGVAALVAAAGISFGLYNANIAKEMELLANEKSALAEEKTQLAADILAEYNDKLMNQSRFYASESLSLLDSGDRRAAALVAAEAIPTAENGRPYIPEAEYALSEALHAYDIGNTPDIIRILNHNMTVREIQKSADGKYLIAIDEGQNVYVWDTGSWEQKVHIPPLVGENNYHIMISEALADDGGVYIMTMQSFSKYDYNGNEVYQKTPPSGSYMDMYLADGKLILTETDRIDILEAEDGSELRTVENEEIESFLGRILYDTERELLIVGHADPEIGNSHVSFIDLEAGKTHSIGLSNEHYLKAFELPTGEIAVLSSAKDIYASNSFGDIYLELFTPEGEKLWSECLDIPIRNAMLATLVLKGRSFVLNGEEVTRIVLAVENHIYSYDAADGALVYDMLLPKDSEELLISLESEYGYVGYSDGQIDFVDLETGTVLASYNSVNGLLEMIPVGGEYVIKGRNSSKLYVMGMIKAPDLTEFMELESSLRIQGVSPFGDYFVMADINGNGLYRFYDMQGTQIYGFDDITDYQREISFCGEKTYITTKTAVYIVDPRAQTRDEISFSDMGVSGSFAGVSLTLDGAYAAGWMLDDLYIFDLNARSCIHEIETEATIGRALINADASKVYLVMSDGCLKELSLPDTAIADFSDAGLHQVADSFREQGIVLSPGGEYLLMTCSDGYARLVDTASREVVQRIPFFAWDEAYLAFTSDGKRLILQGDDRAVRIWDIETQSEMNSFDDGSGLVIGIIDSPETGHLAICYGAGILLLETSSYTRIAEIPGGIVYLPEEGSMLLQASNHIYRCCYKDVAQLLEELEVQFPGETLTDEERAIYNID